jgi:opacity protein-like surface antigen
LFVGAAIPQKSDIDPQLFNGTFHDVAFDTSILYGGKVGLFFDPPVLGGNFGLELEAYHFQPDIDDQTVRFSGGGFTGQGRVTASDVHVTTVALNAPYRLRLSQSPDFPQGRLQPYAGVGIGAFIATFKAPSRNLDVPVTVSDTDVKPGFQAMAGTRFFLTRHIAVFGEYKFTQTADFTFNLISGQGTAQGIPTFEVDKFKFNLTTHTVAAGLSYHW